jgi:hypothetical protein
MSLTAGITGGMFFEMAGAARAFNEFLWKCCEIQESRGFGEMGRGWAIGTARWRKALARLTARGLYNPGSTKGTTWLKGGSLE